MPLGVISPNRSKVDLGIAKVAKLRRLRKPIVTKKERLVSNSATSLSWYVDFNESA